MCEYKVGDDVVVTEYEQGDTVGTRVTITSVGDGYVSYQASKLNFRGCTFDASFDCIEKVSEGGA